MKPEFALILSHDGIGLAHRTRAGWARLGEVSLEAADFADELAALRRQAQSLAPKGVLAKLVIPASQILYTAIYAPGPSPAQRRTQIETALQGMTPYEVSDLVYDWVGTRQTVQVAVVARETLAEAEAFAQSHGFAPICFVAIPMAGDFTGEPWFGLSASAASYLPEGAQVERDMMPLADVLQDTPEAQAEPQEADIAVATEPARPEPEPTPEIEPEPAEEPPEGPAPIGAADTAPEVVQADEAVETTINPKGEDHDQVESEAEVETEVLADVQIDTEAGTEDEAEPSAPLAPQAPADESPTDVTDTPLEPAPPSETITPEQPVAEVTQTAAPDASPPLEARDSADPPEEISEDDLADLAALDQPAETPAEAPEREPDDAANDAPEPDPTPETAEPEAAQSAAKPLSSEAIAALAAVSEFSSSRAAKEQSTADQDAGAPTNANVPKLGGVGRLSPPQPERKKILTGEAGITAPGLDLPDSDPVSGDQTTLKSGKRTLKQVAKKGLSGTAAIGAVALSAKARMASAKTPKKTPPKPTQSSVESPPETTVFGAQKRADVGGKPRYLGASLIGALVLFLAIIALWTNFLSDDNAPAPHDQIAVAPPAALTPDVPAASTPMVAPTTSTPTPTTPEPQSASTATPVPETPEVDASEPAEDTQTAALAPLPPSEMPAFDAAPLAPPSVPQESATVAPEAAPAMPPLVTPTPEGVPMPGGFTLFSGKPDLVPGTRPESVAQAWRATQPPAPLRPSDTLAALPELAGFRPTSRPATLAPPAAVSPAPLPAANDPALAKARPVLRPAAISSKAQSAPDDGAALTPAPTVQDTRLAGLRPDARPASVQSSAQEAAPPSDAFAGASSLAVAASARPPTKPRNFARSVESALAAAIAAEPTPSKTAVAAAPARKTAPVEIDEPEPVKPAPRVPTSASVARQATEKNVINLRKINLIGLYGSSSSRRALVRLKNGKFVKVGVGDRLDGGKVTAIGSTQLTYAKGSRSYTLQLPQGG